MRTNTFVSRLRLVPCPSVTLGAWLPLLAIVAVGGCTSKHIASEEAADIRRVAVVTYVEPDEVRVYDRTGDQVGTGAEVAAGALGGVIGGAVAGAVEGVLSWKAIKASLGGEPQLLVQALGNEPMAPIIDRGVMAALGDLPALGPSDLERLGFTGAPSRRTSDGVPVHDYRPLMDRWNVDTVIELRLRHGLAAYADAPARPVVLGEAFVIDVVEDRVIMKGPVSSEASHTTARRIPELSAEQGLLYRRDIEEASRAVGTLVLAEFRTQAAGAVAAGGDASERAAAVLDDTDGAELP
jgi:hypothetical protein